jgi:hypothetical protein
MRKRKRRKKKRFGRLPNRILVFKNKDKKFHQYWKKGDNPLNFPHPFRMICCGEPDIGKTLTIKNILLRQKPMFERIVVIHDDIETEEYEDCDAEVLGYIPNKEFFDRYEKTLVIIDDLDVKNINKRQTHYLSRLFGSWSTHRNISICLNTQNFYECLPIVRKCANIIILGKNKDLSSRSSIAKKIGLTAFELNKLYNTYIKKDHDMLWFDLTKDSPFKLRLNGYNIINNI